MTEGRELKVNVRGNVEPISTFFLKSKLGRLQLLHELPPLPLSSLLSPLIHPSTLPPLYPPSPSPPPSYHLVIPSSSPRPPVFLLSYFPTFFISSFSPWLKVTFLPFRSINSNLAHHSSLTNQKSPKPALRPPLPLRGKLLPSVLSSVPKMLVSSLVKVATTSPILGMKPA